MYKVKVKSNYSLKWSHISWIVLVTLLIPELVFGQTQNCDGTQISTPCFLNSSLISGTYGQVGASYRFTDVLDDTDAIVTIQNSTGGAWIQSIDFSIFGFGIGCNLQPQVAGSDPGTFNSGDRSVTLEVCFVEDGTFNPVNIPILSITQNDIDGDNCRIKEYVEYIDPVLYTYNDPNGLTITNNVKAVSTTIVTEDGIGFSDGNSMSVQYHDISCYTYIIGMEIDPTFDGCSGAFERFTTASFRCPDYSNPVTNCTPLTNGGAIGYDQSACGRPFNPDPIINLSSPSGGIGTIEYIWMRSTSTCNPPSDENDPNWQVINNANGESYDPGNTNNNTCFVRLAKIINCGNYIPSNVVEITVPSQSLSCSASQLSAVQCFGESNGQATVTPSGGYGGYTYLWDNNETTQTATSLSAGNHTVTVTDSGGCTSTCSVNIDQPSSALSCTATEDSSVVCLGESNGQATVTPSGGSGSYTYLWSNNQTTQTATSLSAGNYTVTVTDSEGCTSTCSVTINQPSAAVSCNAVEDSPVVCFGESTGQATVTATGGNCNGSNIATSGTASSSSEGSGGIPSRINDGNTNGVYSGLSVAHTGGGSSNEWIDLDLQSQQSIEKLIIWNRTDNCCSRRLSNAYVLFSSTPFPNNTNLAQALANAEFTHQLGDANGIASFDISVNMTGRYIRVQKSGTNSGGNTLQVAEIQALLPCTTYPPENYTYLWDNDETTQTATALNAGTHTVTVTDPEGCSSTCSVTINQPSAAVSCSATEDSPVVCFGESNGQATVTPSGGNGGFTYLWDNNETTQTATSLDAGTHTVTVTDSEGCTSSCSVTINQPSAAVSCLATEDSPVVCFGESNGRATVTPSGGNGGFTYLWDNNETTQTATSLDAGTHTVTVTDSQGCSSTCSVTINQPSAAVSCSATENSPVVCFGESNGQATVTPSGGNGGFTYLWDNNETTQTATALNAGTHTVTVTDSEGCSSTCSVTINQPSAAVSCSATEDSPVVCFGESNGQATVTPSGGNGGFTYLWDNNETTQTASSLDAGTHTVTVTDSQGCSSTCSVTINQPSAAVSCSVVEDSPVECFGESNGQATVTPSGGNGGFTYLWDNGETTQTVSNLTAGTHTVTVTDSKGCTSSCSVNINEPALLTCTVDLVQYVECNCNDNGSATVNPVGGNGGYTYSWSNGETTQTAVALSISTHTVTVTDSKGCTTTCSIDMERNPACCLKIYNNGFTRTSRNFIKNP